MSQCTNDDPKEIFVNENVIPSLDFDNINIIDTLQKEKINEFITELSMITFHIENKCVDSPVGYAVLIYTFNNEIIVLSCTVINNIGYSMVATFTYEGTFINQLSKNY